jgi:hypothetical protein
MRPMIYLPDFFFRISGSGKNEQEASEIAECQNIDQQNLVEV